ncbi:MAG: DNA polymerase III subunit delta [Lysobacteraceae bacterium]
MASDPDAPLQRLVDGPLKPVWLLAGPEFLRVQELADRLRARARAEGYTEREVFEAADERFDWDEVVRALSAMSLFAQRRLIEVRLPTGKAGRNGSTAIVELLKRGLPPDILLLFVGGDWSKKHAGKWSQAIAAAGCVVEVWPLKPDELDGWLRRRLQSAGLTADAAALAVLRERVEGNLLAAAQEIDKLAMLRPGARLDAPAMAEAVAESARYNVFGLVDAAVAGDPARVLRVLAGLRAEGEAVPALMGWIFTELQRLAVLSRVQAARGDLAGAFRAANIWPGRQAQYRQLLQRHPPAVWEDLLIAAGRVERMAKGRADGDPWQGLERVLVAVADPRAARLGVDA